MHNNSTHREAIAYLPFWYFYCFSRRGKNLEKVWLVVSIAWMFSYSIHKCYRYVIPENNLVGCENGWGDALNDFSILSSVIQQSLLNDKWIRTGFMTLPWWLRMLQSTSEEMTLIKIQVDLARMIYVHVHGTERPCQDFSWLIVLPDFDLWSSDYLF